MHDTGKTRARRRRRRCHLMNKTIFFKIIRIGPGGFQLLIIQAEPSQAGTYTCLAYSKAGEAKQQFRLTVLGKKMLEEKFFFLCFVLQNEEISSSRVFFFLSHLLLQFHHEFDEEIPLFLS